MLFRFHGTQLIRCETDKSTESGQCHNRSILSRNYENLSRNEEKLSRACEKLYRILQKYSVQWDPDNYDQRNWFDHSGYERNVI